MKFLQGCIYLTEKTTGCCMQNVWKKVHRVAVSLCCIYMFNIVLVEFNDNVAFCRMKVCNEWQKVDGLMVSSCGDNTQLQCLQRSLVFIYVAS